MDIRNFFVKSPHGSNIIASSSDISFKDKPDPALDLSSLTNKEQSKNGLNCDRKYN